MQKRQRGTEKKPGEAYKVAKTKGTRGQGDGTRSQGAAYKMPSEAYKKPLEPYKMPQEASKTPKEASGESNRSFPSIPRPLLLSKAPIPPNSRILLLRPIDDACTVRRYNFNPHLQIRDRPTRRPHSEHD